MTLDERLNALARLEAEEVSIDSLVQGFQLDRRLDALARSGSDLRRRPHRRSLPWLDAAAAVLITGAPLAMPLFDATPRSPVALRPFLESFERVQHSDEFWKAYEQIRDARWKEIRS
jgi:hypothetical protein